MPSGERDEMLPVLVMGGASHRAQGVDLSSRHFDEGPILVSRRRFHDDELHTELRCYGCGLLM